MNPKSIIVILFSIVLIASVCLIGCPRYMVYQQEMAGKAELAKANYSKQVATQEAKAKLESAADLAKADVIRAEGVAKANKIIGESLQNNEAYLHWLWIDQLEKNQNAVFYVPTENNLPIMVNPQPKK